MAAVSVLACLLHPRDDARAEMFPARIVAMQAHVAPVIVEGRAAPGDRLVVEQIYRDDLGVARVGEALAVESLDAHDRRIGACLRTTDGRDLKSDRVVAFLRRDPATGRLRPLHTGRARVEGKVGSEGILWIEGGAVFGYGQVVNPGPVCLMETPGDAASLRTAIREGVAASRRFRGVVAIEDPAHKARALVRYLFPPHGMEAEARTFRYHVREPLGALGAVAVPEVMEAVERVYRYAPVGEAALVLHDLGPVAREAVPLLARVLDESPDWESRLRAIEALGRIGDPAAVPALRRALDRGDLGQAAEAATALAALGDGASLERIAQRLPLDPQRRDERAVRGLLQALVTLDGERGRALIVRWAATPKLREAPEWLAALLRPHGAR